MFSDDNKKKKKKLHTWFVAVRLSLAEIEVFSSTVEQK
jgi:hypothetical protein